MFNEPAVVVNTGFVLSVIVITCVNVSVLPHASVAVNTFVYVPLFGQLPATNAPVVVFVTVGVEQLSVANGASAWADAMPDVLLHSNVLFNEPANVVITGFVVSVIVIICVNTNDTLPHASLAVNVLVYVPACGHVVPVTKAPEFFVIVVVEQLSVADGVSAWAAVSPAASLHSTVLFNEPANVVITGFVVSVIVMVCVYTNNDTLPHASVAVNVLVYVPACGHVVPATKAPGFFEIVVVEQLSEADGVSAWAAVNPAASLHSTVLFNEPANVVITGFVVSVILITCVNVDVLPHASVAVNILVYLPFCGHVVPATKAPGFFVIVADEQLSVADGVSAWAAVSPAASLHSTVLFNEPAVVVNTGATMSLTFTTFVTLVPWQAKAPGATGVKLNVTVLL